MKSLNVGSAIALLAVISTPPSIAQSQSRCATQVAEQRSAWGVTGPPRLQPPAVAGAEILHWPTSTLGTWVVEVRLPNDVTLRRVTDSDLTEVMWSDQCVPSTTTTTRQTSAAARFTDADLRRAIAAQPRGLLYVWSPHMPLSVEGVAQARFMAERRGLSLIVLLDPAANEALARSVAAQHAWPPDTVLVADSTELRFRDVLVHAPTLQAFAGGRLVGSAFPGHHSSEEYAAYLDRIFATVR